MTIDEMLRERGKQISVPAWEQLPTIQEQLPILFPNKARIEELSSRCSACDEPIPASEIRGRCEVVSQHVAEVRALGCCRECNTMTAVEIDFWDDLSMVGPVPGKLRRIIGFWRSKK